MRHILKSLQGEEGMFGLLDEALACLRRQMALGDTTAAQIVVKYCLVPMERREGLLAELERVRLSEETGDEAA